MFTIKTILHPTDFSPSSFQALELACSLARDSGARLLIQHVVPPMPRLTGEVDRATWHRVEHAEEDLRTEREEKRARLESLPIPIPGLRVERLLDEGDVAATILRRSHTAACSLVVLGTRGVGGSKAPLMGSVAEEVVQRAACPVIVVALPAGATCSVPEPATAAAE
jgi:universal stress protein A